MRIRALALIASACVLLAVNTIPEVTRVHAFSDADRDTIDDVLEYALASQFYPLVWISNGDLCPNPDPRPVLFRARHPSVFGNLRTDWIVISYVQLFDEDCGFGGHNGDNEPFEVWLRRNGSNWEWGSVSGVAHWDKPFETRTWSYSPELWIGANKHGTYADRNQCGLPSGDDYCGGLARRMQEVLYNVGEPYEWLLNELGLVRSYWGQEKVWDDDHFLSAGHIRSQLFHNKYITPFHPPLGYNCAARPYTDCWDSEGQEWVPPSSPPPSNDVTFYEHIDYVGGSFASSSDIQFVGWDWNDQISSIRVPPGRTVVLYEHSEFSGQSITVTSDVPDIRDIGSLGYGWWNDQVSSIRIY